MSSHGLPIEQSRKYTSSSSAGRTALPFRAELEKEYTTKIPEITKVTPFNEKEKQEPVQDESENMVYLSTSIKFESLKKRIEEKKQERLRKIVSKINMKLPNALTKIAEKEENKVTLWRTWRKKDGTVLFENKDRLLGMLNLPQGIEIQVKKPKRTGIFVNVYAYIR